MKEWNEVVQRMIEWIEAHMDQSSMLKSLSDEMGYSPWYCSVLFHDVTGMTLKSYVSGRRLARAAEEIRDTDERILDIAMKQGYSSQEALSRLFKRQFGCTPAAYRRFPVPIPLQIYKVVLFPDNDEKRIKTMEASRLGVRVEHIPAHKYLEWIEAHMDQSSMLKSLSDEMGYSPWYCSVLFHDVTGMTLKSYVSGRRLARAAEEIRDTDERILDIAMKQGYSSQEALSRLFKRQFGCTPAAYRRFPVPIPLQIYKVVLFPDNDEKRIKTMEASRLGVRVEHIPAHKYLGIWDERAKDYCEFWQYHDCDEVNGFVTSMDKMAHPIVTAHTAGWTRRGGKVCYFYGTGIPSDYQGPVPEGFEIRDIPESYYLVFSYPTFDYMTENVAVMGAVEKLAWSFDPRSMGYEWNEEACQDYQRHYPEKLGYQILRPVRKIVP